MSSSIRAVSGTITIQPGTTNEVDVTNTARGVIEVCKDQVDFGQRRVDDALRRRSRRSASGLMVVGCSTVQAGACSPKIRVAPGPHTVTELAESDYELVSITASPAER